MSEYHVLASLLISAAASLQAPLEEVALAFEKQHPEVTINLNFGGSNALARQIENGAPTDLFLSAASEPVDQLVETNVITSSAVVPFLTNTLVLITRTDLPDLTSLAELTSPSIRTIAIGEPATAPAGAYAFESLQKLGLLEKLRPKFVYAKDVRQALTWVATGNADAGFVYASDVTDRVRQATSIPNNLHKPIRVSAALIRENPDSRRFLEFLLKPDSLAIFEAHSFKRLNPEP